MLYHIFKYLEKYSIVFHVFHYISFRVIISFITSLIFCLIFGSWFIKRSRLFRSTVREYTPESHGLKNNTPTMGGIFTLLSIMTTIFLWCDVTKPEVWIFIFCLLGFGLIGFFDDYLKIHYKKGIRDSVKFRAQLIVAFFVSSFWYFFACKSTAVCVPFFKNFMPDLGILVIPWATFLLVATSNAVNLTDGLDGLAIGSLISNFVTFSIIAYLAGNVSFAHYLKIPYVQSSEIAIIGSTLIGSSLGFLWYNAYPAQIWMGDIGSLSLGAGLALMVIMARQELLLVIAGGLFVIETVSVIAQVFTFKFFKKRIFKMAPLHHHFELLGWPESKITTRFGIISLVLCLLALATLKMR